MRPSMATYRVITLDFASSVTESAIFPSEETSGPAEAFRVHAWKAPSPFPPGRVPDTITCMAVHSIAFNYWHVGYMTRSYGIPGVEDARKMKTSPTEARALLLLLLPQEYVITYLREDLVKWVQLRSRIQKKNIIIILDTSFPKIEDVGKRPSVCVGGCMCRIGNTCRNRQETLDELGPGLITLFIHRLTKGNKTKKTRTILSRWFFDYVCF